jgi:hypothetical protein
MDTSIDNDSSTRDREDTTYSDGPCTICEEYIVYHYKVCACDAEPRHITCNPCYYKLKRVCESAPFNPNICITCNGDDTIKPYIDLVRNPHRIAHITQTPDLCIAALHVNGNVLPLIINKTPEMYDAAVSSTGTALAHVPPEFHTPELYAKIGSKEHYDYEHIPDSRCSMRIEKIKPDNIGDLLPRYPRLLYDIPEEYITSQRLFSIIERYPRSILEIPSRFITHELWDYTLTQDIDLYRYIPTRFITPELALKIIPRRGSFIKHIPSYMITYEMCYAAVKKHQRRDIYEYIPEDLRTDEINALIEWDNDDMFSVYTGCIM